MPDIFDEVEEDLRAEQMRGLLRRYGGLAIGVLILLVAGVAGWQAWNWHDGRQAAAIADRYAAATKIAQGRPGPGRQDAVPMFAAIARDSHRDGYRTLAQLQQAALLAQAGDLPGASALWDQVQSDPAADRLLRDLAGLQWVEHHLDSASPAELGTRLAPLAQADNPFHGLAQEDQGLLDMRQGRIGAARDTLGPLAHDALAPEGVRQRAGFLLTQLGAAQAAAQVAKGRGS